uniref:Uncharacterized protein n=1 Tax=Elaeophora elaphi TaxID=1147741 RepID=A0A0R3S1L0_9BILA
MMVMKGDELLKKLRNILLNGSSASCSAISPTIDITGLNLPSLSQADTISIAATATSTDQSLISPLSPATTDIVSANHILKNMIENVECEGNDESLVETIKSRLNQELKSVNFDKTDTAQCITDFTESKYPSTDMIHSSSMHNRRPIKTETNEKAEVSTPSTIILNRNSENGSLTIRELLGLDSTNKRKLICANESLSGAKTFRQI